MARRVMGRALQQALEGRPGLRHAWRGQRLERGTSLHPCAVRRDERGQSDVGFAGGLGVHVSGKAVALPRNRLDVRLAAGVRPSSLRSADTACSRLLSVTATSLHAATTSASFETIAPGLASSAANTSRWRAGTFSAAPSCVSCRAPTSKRNGPNV